MAKAVQKRRHALASEGVVSPAKKRFRACKKIPVLLVKIMFFIITIAYSICDLFSTETKRAQRTCLPEREC
jgi:hypothetical protein